MIKKMFNVLVICLIFMQLTHATAQSCHDNHSCDLIVFSYKRPMQLYALLESLQEYVTGLHKITVLYRADDRRYEQAYTNVKNDFANILFVQQSKNNPHADFKPLFINLLSSNSSDYIMFATDDNLVKDYVSISDCIQALQKTHAYGFYLRLGKNLNYCYPMNCAQGLPHLIAVENSIYSWDMKAYENVLYDWSYPTTVDMTIYKTNDILSELQSIPFNNPNTLEGNWAQSSNHNLQKIGLCFERSKIVNIPINRVQSVSPINKSMDQDPDELLSLFEQGFKIDRSPLHQWHNNAAHTECEFIFTLR